MTKLDPEKMWVSVTTVSVIIVALFGMAVTWGVLNAKVEAHQEKINSLEQSLEKISQSVSRIEVDASITRTKVESIERYYSPARRAQ